MIIVVGYFFFALRRQTNIKLVGKAREGERKRHRAKLCFMLMTALLLINHAKRKFIAGIQLQFGSSMSLGEEF